MGLPSVKIKSQCKIIYLVDSPYVKGNIKWKEFTYLKQMYLGGGGDNGQPSMLCTFLKFSAVSMCFVIGRKQNNILTPFQIT